MRLIDADALEDEMYHKSFEVDDGRNVWNSGLWIRYKIFEEAIRDAPTVDAVPIIRCKDCKHYERDHFDAVYYPTESGEAQKVPLITAHEICTKWGDGCKTAEDGYCFLGERKEE